jgi:hypothetical protein
MIKNAIYNELLANVNRMKQVALLECEKNRAPTQDCLKRGRNVGFQAFLPFTEPAYVHFLRFKLFTTGKAKIQHKLNHKMTYFLNTLPSQMQITGKI